jgi:myosin-5
MASASEQALVRGAKVWVSSGTDQWVLATLRSTSGERYVVVLEDGSESALAPAALTPANPGSHTGIHDLTKLSYLNEPGLLHCLRGRFDDNDIYTMAGGWVCCAWGWA